MDFSDLGLDVRVRGVAEVSDAFPAVRDHVDEHLVVRVGEENEAGHDREEHDGEESEYDFGYGSEDGHNFSL